ESTYRSHADRIAAQPPFISLEPRPQTYPLFMMPEKGEYVHPSSRAGTTSTWPQKRSGRCAPIVTRLHPPPEEQITCDGTPRASRKCRIYAIIPDVSPGGFSLRIFTRSAQICWGCMPEFTNHDVFLCERNSAKSRESDASSYRLFRKSWSK